MKIPFIRNLIILSLSAFLLNGCMGIALNLSPSLFPNLTTSIFEECDPDLAKSAIPANLKLLEGLLKNDPGNKRILKTLCIGFCGYSMLFIEEDNPDRASQLYLRARDYGLRALGKKGIVLKDLKTKDFGDFLERIQQDEIETLFWITTSWNAWIALNLDNTAAIAQLTTSQACLEHVLDVDPDYLHGLPYILMGASLSARPPLFGGDIEQAREYFETALSLNDRQFFLAQYYYAKYYAVRKQDRVLFSELVDEILRGDPKTLPDICLINTVIHDKAKDLKTITNTLFF